MNIIEKKTVDMLTENHVSILTQKFIEIDGVNQQVGSNHRCSYQNSETGRNKLIAEQSESVVNSVMAIWGDTPTIVEEEPETEIEGDVETETEETESATEEE